MSYHTHRAVPALGGARGEMLVMEVVEVVMRQMAVVKIELMVRQEVK